ncbi:MAG: tripartite tricarboxylate transporter TctB family protein [Methylobacteriaceae bacterium]|nr:tripartite tricarboxylate transporter TctB family protein [Methylobacteriaceae bacterium]
MLVLIGLGTIYQPSRYDVCTLSEIGPGFFPMVMGVILAGCGIAIAFNQSSTGDDEHDAGTLSRRPLAKPRPRRCRRCHRG